MANAVTELTPVRTLLDEATEATPEELQCVANALDGWIADSKWPLAVRIDGLAWLGQQLSGARFSKVRGARLQELMETLISALPQELPLHPVDPATRAQQATLRQAAFFRLEDPKIGELRRAVHARVVPTARAALAGVVLGAQLLRQRLSCRGRIEKAHG